MPNFIGEISADLDKTNLKEKDDCLLKIEENGFYLGYDDKKVKDGLVRCFETENFIFYFDGFIFNDDKAFWVEVLGKELDLKKLFSEVDGVYRSIIYDKKKLKLYFVVDHLATKKIFYCYDSNGIAFSSNLFDLPNKEFGFDGLDLSSIYFFLGFGFYESGNTFVKNIRQVEAGSIVEYDIGNRDITVSNYHDFNVKKRSVNVNDEILSDINSCLKNNVKKIAEHNLKNGYELYCSLSGGLDAKTITVMLRELYPDEPINTLTFAQSGSSDQRISQSVANELHTSHFYKALDNGTYLYSLVLEYVYATSGMISFHGSLHTYNFYSKLNSNNIGLCFSGQIGDVVFGSAIDHDFNIESDFDKISYTGKIPNFIADKIVQTSSIINNYKQQTFEVFNLEQRQSGGTIYGDVCLTEVIDTISPFYGKKLIQLSLTIDDSEKLHEKLYLQWLKKYYPKVLNFPWDKTGCKPSSYEKVRLMKFYTSARNSILRRVQFDYDSMNPMDKWIRENPKILEFLNKNYNENISLLDFDSNLKEDVVKLYVQDNDKFLRKKFTVVTLLLAIKKLVGR